MKKLIKKIEIKKRNFSNNCSGKSILRNNPLKKLEKKEKFLIKKSFKNIQEIANEYGNQILGMDILDLKSLEDLVTMYKDYVITTIVHHPTNWLNWDIRRTSEQNDFYSKILKNTDLLLTGHEHVPIDHKIDYKNNKKVLHIPAGCFLEEQSKNQHEIIGSNWFSILEFNNTKKNIIQQKYFYNVKKGNWEDKKEDIKPKKLNNKHDFELPNNRKKKIINEGIKYFEKIKGNPKNNISNGAIFNLHKKKKLRIFMQSYKENDFTNLKSSFNDIKEIIKSSNGTIDIVCLIFFDFKHDKFKDYCCSKDKLSVLGDIKNNLDFLFDKFRGSFFASLINEEVEAYKNLKIISKIIPYWEIKTFMA